MKINGETKHIASKNVAELIEDLALHDAPIVVELNGCIISKSDFIRTLLKPEDVIEIVQFVGGG